MEWINGAEIVVDSTDTVNVNNLMGRCRQRHKAYFVESKSLSVLSKCGIVLAVTGSVLPDLEIADTPVITEEDALYNVLDSINASFGYVWEDSLLEKDIKEVSNDTNATNYPEGELLIVKKFDLGYADIADNYILCWKLDVKYFDTVTADSVFVDTGYVNSYTDTTVKRRVAYVNAITGNIEALYDNTMHSSHSGDQWTWHYGYKNDEITTRYDCFLPPCKYVLADDVTKIYTKRTQGAKEYKDNNNNWVEDDTKTAAQAHWAATKGVLYFKYEHGYNIIPSGNSIRIYCDNFQLAVQRVNAAWGVSKSGDDEISVRSDMKINGVGKYAPALDIINHELVHGIINGTSKVGMNQHKSGHHWALNEGFCDIFGILAEGWANNGIDWEFGEDAGFYSRFFEDPTNDTRTPGAATHQDVFWNFGGHDDPYIKSGLLRRWFYRLSQVDGTWGTLQGIGVYKASQIAFNLMAWHLWEGSHYWDARNQSLLIAEKHFGGRCGPVWCAVEKAWSDVGFGTPSVCNAYFYPSYPSVMSTNDYYDHVIKIDPILPRVSGTDFDVITYDWLVIPPHWNITYNGDQSGFTITDVGSNFSSQMVTCVVEYNKAGFGMTSFYDTLTFPVHFSDECSGSSKPSRQGINAGKITGKLSDIKVYPNPTFTELFIVGAVPGTTIEIYNSVGQKVYATTVNDLYELVNTSQFIPGIYMLNMIDNEGKKEIRKVVKQ